MERAESNSIRLLVERLKIVAVGWVLFLCVSCSHKGAFMVAEPERALVFPRDHGAHPEFRTEWWYDSGHLDAEDGSRYGFHLAFFVRRTEGDIVYGVPAPLIANPAHSAHLAISDLQSKKLYFDERFSNDAGHRRPGQGRAATERLDLSNKGWSAQERDGIHYVEAESRSHAIELALTPTKPMVLYGEDGFLLKGMGKDGKKHGSFYTGYSSLEGKGLIRVDGKTLEVEASAWFDHEFGSYHLSRSQRGWDWFSVQLDDGSELMVYLMKAKDGVPDRSYGVWIDPAGQGTHLCRTDISLRPTAHWKSPMTGAIYDTDWSLEVKSRDLILDLKAEIPESEIMSWGAVTVYWEGAVMANGKRSGKSISGRGFVEQAGRAHVMRRLWEPVFRGRGE